MVSSLSCNCQSSFEAIYPHTLEARKSFVVHGIRLKYDCLLTEKSSKHKIDAGYDISLDCCQSVSFWHDGDDVVEDVNKNKKYSYE